MKFIVFIAALFLNVCYAQGVAGLNYKVFAAGGPTPTMTESGRTLLASGISPNISYDWGSGNVLATRSEGVIVHWTGYIKWPDGAGQRTISFFSASDDGFFMSINGTNVISSWREQGTQFYNGSGSITLTAGQTYYIDVWWYENGGGAAAFLYWNIGSGIVLVPTSNLATESTFWQPSLCCGGSSASFSIPPTQASKINAFTTRTTSDTKVFVEQIGNGNDITIQQSGTKNNYVNYFGSGTNNDVTITQSSTISNMINYTDISLQGNTNTVNVLQQSTGGLKATFIDVQNNNNSLNIQQKDNGNHYTNVAVSGGSKTVSVTQQGSASHMANIGLTGNPTSLSLTQSGSTQQSYTIQHNCATAGGCSPIVVTQGQ